MQNKITHFEIVMKLIGEITPVGETNTDIQRLKNLKQLCELTDRLVYQINQVAIERDSKEYSVKQVGEYAHNFLTELKEALPK